MGNSCCRQIPEQNAIEKPLQTSYRGSGSIKGVNQPVISAKTNENIAQIHNVQTQINQQPAQKTIQLPDGSKYVGVTRLGIPHGRGTEYHENGDKYIGEFKEGVKTGKGRYEYSSGIIYEGDFNQGDIEGTGRMEWPNGDWYEGGFKNNNMNGFGKYFSKSNDSYYEGTYLNGKRHGKGIIKSDKNILEGYWQLGVFKFKKVIPYQPI